MRYDDMFDSDTQFQDRPDRSMYGDELDLLGEEIINELELLGYNTNDIDLLGGPFARLFKKIRDRVRARRAARAEKKARAGMPPAQAEVPYTISTPQGVLRADSTGLALTKPAGGVPVQAQAGFNPMEMLKQNPMLLLVPVAGIAIMMMGKKRRTSNGGGNGGSRRKRRR